MKNKNWPIGTLLTVNNNSEYSFAGCIVRTINNVSRHGNVRVILVTAVSQDYDTYTKHMQYIKNRTIWYMHENELNDITSEYVDLSAIAR